MLLKPIVVAIAVVALAPVLLFECNAFQSPATNYPTTRARPTNNYVSSALPNRLTNAPLQYNRILTVPNYQRRPLAAPLLSAGSGRVRWQPMARNRSPLVQPSARPQELGRISNVNATTSTTTASMIATTSTTPAPQVVSATPSTTPLVVATPTPILNGTTTTATGDSTLNATPAPPSQLATPPSDGTLTTTAIGNSVVATTISESPVSTSTLPTTVMNLDVDVDSDRAVGSNSA